MSLLTRPLSVARRLPARRAALRLGLALVLGACLGANAAQPLPDPMALVRQIQTQGMDAQAAMSTMNAAAARMGIKTDGSEMGKSFDALSGATGLMFKGLAESAAPGTANLESAGRVLNLVGPPSLSTAPRWVGAGSLPLTPPGLPGDDIRRRACKTVARSALGVNQPGSFTAQKMPLTCASASGRS